MQWLNATLLGLFTSLPKCLSGWPDKKAAGTCIIIIVHVCEAFTGMYCGIQEKSVDITSRDKKRISHLNPWKWVYILAPSNVKEIVTKMYQVIIICRLKNKFSQPTTHSWQLGIEPITPVTAEYMHGGPLMLLANLTSLSWVWRSRVTALVCGTK